MEKHSLVILTADGSICMLRLHFFFCLFHLRGLNLLLGIINEAVDGFISTPAPISIISVQRDSLTFKTLYYPSLGRLIMITTAAV